MANGIQKAIFLIMGGWNSYNMVQAAQEDAQKSQNLLYHITLNGKLQNYIIMPSGLSPKQFRDHP